MRTAGDRKGPPVRPNVVEPKSWTTRVRNAAEKALSAAAEDLLDGVSGGGPHEYYRHVEYHLAQPFRLGVTSAEAAQARLFVWLKIYGGW